MHRQKTCSCLFPGKGLSEVLTSVSYQETQHDPNEPDLNLIELQLYNLVNIIMIAANDYRIRCCWGCVDRTGGISHCGKQDHWDRSSILLEDCNVVVVDTFRYIIFPTNSPPPRIRKLIA